MLPPGGYEIMNVPLYIRWSRQKALCGAGFVFRCGSIP
jgi:hypothetical protein